ncbi:DUF6588 family protein [Salinimicrobium sp. HB62]|uniref:DUF6588 family protein n=1 Tax=Salinimicrobium sp. HB62 TaxID=3077781 RepID=UPI002D781AC3|nr:DUF6588 family protein [Salinimicrobium sp. HB62]
MKKLLIIFIAFLSSPCAVFAQTNVAEFIDDMLVLGGNFSQPAAEAAGYQASAGWFSSAIPLDKWDFRISVHGNALFVPSEKKKFFLSNSDLKVLKINESENAVLPTAFGGSSSVYLSGEVYFNGALISEPSFPAMEGINRSYVPHAFVQAAIGVSAGTEVTVRAMPEVTIDGVAASTYGLGIKHNLSQYFGYSYPEDFQLAFGASYSKLIVGYEFDPIGAADVVELDKIDVDANLFMGELIGSKKWGLFEAIVAAGAMNSQFSYTFGGRGEVDLVNAEVDKIEDSKIQFKGDVGFNLYFSQLRVSTMLTAGEFFNANLGLHVSI